jgi:D-amino-acid oxidase
MNTIGIIGTGVNGLGTAMALRRRFPEMNVTLLSDEKHYSPTSGAAAAFWYPYAVNMPGDWERILAEPTFHFYLGEASNDPRSGCTMVEGEEYFDLTVAHHERRRPWWSEIPQVQFTELHAEDIDPRIRENEVVGPFNGGWRFVVPVINMRKFLPWLREQAENCGCEFKNKRVESLSSLRGEFLIVINCSGGWATHLIDDPALAGYQGVLARVPGNLAGRKLIFIEKGRWAVRPIYIVPQGDQAVLGGTLEQMTGEGKRWLPGDEGRKRFWTPDPDEVTKIIELCSVFSPSLSSLIDRPSPGLVETSAGLRPRRHSGPWIGLDESIDEPAVIHNYGHGGAGVTMFWGSAIRTADIVESLLASPEQTRDAA